MWRRDKAGGGVTALTISSERIRTTHRVMLSYSNVVALTGPVRRPHSNRGQSGGRYICIWQRKVSIGEGGSFHSKRLRQTGEEGSISWLVSVTTASAVSVLVSLLVGIFQPKLQNTATVPFLSLFCCILDFF